MQHLSSRDRKGVPSTMSHRSSSRIVASRGNSRNDDAADRRRVRRLHLRERFHRQRRCSRRFAGSRVPQHVFQRIRRKVREAQQLSEGPCGQQVTFQKAWRRRASARPEGALYKFGFGRALPPDKQIFHRAALARRVRARAGTGCRSAGPGRPGPPGGHRRAGHCSGCAAMISSQSHEAL